ncbi:uncharacterized protein LACBIDRAFT_334550 [Laccaria bicolor S238N-H82]|uniref:Predicted protein n=1 Tax=Laccaria bicolor (strain S238N-H82 / ATCC MYA-4686) TaxID=486041 RepID=B0DZI2_LACBS|nr:uncharacterized protein LACBIDRAFT_334550 [Laccaria bicolor S238N-H82]EDR00027.1 predicted protein [Laccaria bicolor S238N-H82]|eukprot:XP_001889336.1 predicted protein [Laccaria bicolor S238N-H82]
MVTEDTLHNHACYHVASNVLKSPIDLIYLALVSAANKHTVELERELSCSNISQSAPAQTLRNIIHSANIFFSPTHIFSTTLSFLHLYASNGKSSFPDMGSLLCLERGEISMYSMRSVLCAMNKPIIAHASLRVLFQLVWKTCIRGISEETWRLGPNTLIYTS